MSIMLHCPCPMLWYHVNVFWYLFKQFCSNSLSVTLRRDPNLHKCSLYMFLKKCNRSLINLHWQQESEKARRMEGRGRKWPLKFSNREHVIDFSLYKMTQAKCPLSFYSDWLSASQSVGFFLQENFLFGTSENGWIIHFILLVFMLIFPVCKGGQLSWLHASQVICVYSLKY